MKIVRVQIHVSVLVDVRQYCFSQVTHLALIKNLLKSADESFCLFIPRMQYCLKHKNSVLLPRKTVFLGSL